MCLLVLVLGIIRWSKIIMFLDSDIVSYVRKHIPPSCHLLLHPLVHPPVFQFLGCRGQRFVQHQQRSTLAEDYQKPDALLLSDGYEGEQRTHVSIYS